MRELLQDLRYGWRMLVKNPGFAAVAVLTLALGIGAGTAVFSVINALVLKPLPVAEPQRLVWITPGAFSYPIFERVREFQRIFSGVFASNLQRLNVEWSSEAQVTPVLLVTPEFYTTLRVHAIVGRTFGSETDAAVISHACWQQRFGGDPHIVGKIVRIERVPFTVVGVTPPDFFGVTPGAAPEITIVAGALPSLRPEARGILRSSAFPWLQIMARLRPGVTPEQAEAAFQVFWPRVLEATFPPDPSEQRKRFVSRSATLVPGAYGHSPARDRLAEPLYILLAIVCLVSIVICASIANLLLARIAARRREIAVRLALGATHGRIIRLVLAEGLVVIALAALLGLVFCVWASQGLVSLLSTRSEAVVVSLPLDWRMAVFSALSSLAAVSIIGAAAAFRAARIAPNSALNERQGESRGQSSFVRALVAAQVALSLLLVTGGALFVRSLWELLSVDLGFQAGNVLLVTTDAVGAAYRGPRLISLYEEMLARTRGTAGVESAALSLVPPISQEGGMWTRTISIDSGPAALYPGPPTYFNAVSPGYFATLRTALVRGRDFTPQDSANAQRVAIINESLARTFFPGQDPLGRRISIGLNPLRQNAVIVGVVEDTKYQRLHEPSRRIAYFSWLQSPEFLDDPNTLRLSNALLVVRARPHGPSVARALLGQIRALDAAIPVQLETISDRIRDSLVRERALAAVSGLLGLVALFLSALALFGMVAHNVTRRTQEIGIRIALGATSVSVIWTVMRDALWLVAAGLALGALSTSLASRWIAGILFGVRPSDPLTIACAIALLAAVAAAAAYLPARRAARVDPMVALRYE